MTFYFEKEAGFRVDYRSDNQGHAYRAATFGSIHAFRETLSTGRKLGYLHEDVSEIRALWPLTVGSATRFSDTYFDFTDCPNWEATCAKPLGQMTITLRVESRESIFVPAGRFDVYVIRRERRLIGNVPKNSRSSWTRFWYAPAIGWHVKFAYHTEVRGVPRQWVRAATDISHQQGLERDPR